MACRESQLASHLSLPRVSALTCPSKKCTESPDTPYVSIKIPALFSDAKNEMEKLYLIQNANPSHVGYSFIHTPLDHFDLPGPEGTRACLIYEPMRETLSQYQSRFPRRRIDGPIFKLHIYLILKALDYLHTECRLVHTGETRQVSLIVVILTRHHRYQE